MNIENNIRRSSLLGQWGVGAIVPFPNDESYMIAGLDMWRYRDSSTFIIEDERLRKRIGVEELRNPPDYREKATDNINFGLTIPAVRFPTWYYCPFCGQMKRTSLYEKHPMCDQIVWKNGPICKFPKRMIPEDFVVICSKGHIDDFPIAEWVHYGSGHTYNKDTCIIRRSSNGATSTVNRITYSCTCGAKRSLIGALEKNGNALKQIGYHCKGLRPWLGEDKEKGNGCSCQDFYAVPRGETSIWFPNTISSIYIPIDDIKTSKKILEILDTYYDVIEGYKEDENKYKEEIFKIAQKKQVNKQSLYNAFKNRDGNLKKSDSDNKNEQDEDYRFAEYQVLKRSTKDPSGRFISNNYDISVYDPAINKYFKSISLVNKLTETRAFVGFSRNIPRNISETERKEMLRLGKEKWLPAIQTKGEGIFIEFNSATVEKWAQNKNMLERISILQKSFQASYFSENKTTSIRPEYILLHTFAHLLINQLSFECGYGAASIRERIYCEKFRNKYNMYGVLIYTAAEDTDGSLGGLVRQGKTGNLENTIKSAVLNAQWCSSDPVCIESKGQGPESCNLAACYNCSLLPETSCENFNILLDRGLIVGDLEHKDIGYFKDLLDD